MKLFDLNDRIGLVVGAGRGLGRAAAIAFAECGARVAVCARTMKEVEGTAKLIEATGSEVLAVRCDVTSRSDCDHVVSETVGRFQGIDFALCAAGVFDLHNAVDATEREWNRAIDVNLTGAFNITQSIGRQLIKQGRGGSITVVSSNASMVAFPGLLAYNASKGGVDQLVRTCAAEWGRYGIRVNAIAPGYMTNVMRDAEQQNEREDELVKKQIEELTPLERTGSDDEFVGPAIFLASDASGFITGAVLPVDGGYTAL